MSVRQTTAFKLGRLMPVAAASLLLGLAALSVVFAPPDAQANSRIRRAFFEAYPEAIGTRLDTLPGNAQHCGVCHYDFNGGGARNAYGQAVSATPNRTATEILALGAIDSDLDGFDNEVEILDSGTVYDNTPTFPGLTLDNVEQTRNIPLEQIMGYLTPTAACDPCDMNCDGAVNALDIEAFIALLFDPNATPCDPCTGDMNGDGSIDALDIEPFLVCLFP